MGGATGDPRLQEAQCPALQPVTVEHENPYFLVRNRGGYFTIEYHRPQAVVLALVEDAVVLVRARRPVIGDSPLELPAGGAEPGESLVQTAARELAEEAGIHVEDLRRFVELLPISVEPGRDPRLVFVVRVAVTPAEYAARRPPDREIETVQLATPDELRRMLRTGELYVALPIAVIGRHLLGADGRPR